MHASWARLGAATVVAAALTTGTVVATAGTAAGGTAPVVIGSCATTVKGDPGTPVELSPSAVVAPVVSIVHAVPVLGPTLAQPVSSAFTALPPIPIGALPTGTGTISGGQIATAVTAKLKTLPVLGPVLGTVVGQVQSQLTSMCGVTVVGVNKAVAPVQQGASTVDSASQQAQRQLGIAPKQQSGSPSGGTGHQVTPPAHDGGPPAKQSGGGGTGGGSGLPAVNSKVLGGLPGLGPATGSGFGAGTLLDYGLAESPLARYAGIPFASAGLFDPAPGVRYGGNVPGYAPTSGRLGQHGSGAGVDSDGVQTAGHAEALASGAGGPLGDGVGLPMLLAVLLLAGVTAALVRTWVLRRVRVS